MDGLPQGVETTMGGMREADGVPPIHWNDVLPLIDKGFPIDRIGMAYVPPDVGTNLHDENYDLGR